MKKILQDPDFQEKLAQLAEIKGEKPDKVKKEAAGYLKELYTVQHPISSFLAAETTQHVFLRGYEKTIDVNPSEIKALSKLMRRNSIAFVMTHKTYIDMFVLGVVLYRHGLPIPYIFGGINMNFMGLGQLGKKSGAIFIRRSFKDNLVYKATLRHFIKSLVDQMSHFMWAIEGTRSRTGKLVWPKMGILKYIMEAQEDSRNDVKYVPVSIVYDLIPDVKDMTEEAKGLEKKPESLMWFLNYLLEMGEGFGRISLRFGEPVDISSPDIASIYYSNKGNKTAQNRIPRFALELSHQINRVTPVATVSLICTVLLSKFALAKRGIESDVADLMQIIESHKPDVLVDRGKPIGEAVQIALKLLMKADLVRQMGTGIHTKYNLVADNYLQASYYANMAAHHVYHRAFIELALIKCSDLPGKERAFAFWSDIMQLRDLFKFEFFFSRKARFSDEIESDLALIHPNWQAVLSDPDQNPGHLLENQKILVAAAVLHTYVEAYRVVAFGLQSWNPSQAFDEKEFLDLCITLGGEMHWQGRIHRVEAVSKPFLQNGIRLAQNRDLIPTSRNHKKKGIEAFSNQLEEIGQRLRTIQEITLKKGGAVNPKVPVKRDIVPGSKTTSITQDIMDGEEGPHIGAFFDLDRTLIKGFSAREFFQTRLLSGKITAKELIAQFSGVLVYAMGDGQFASLAATSARGVEGVKEQVFIDLGEEVYLKYLANAIYPESRALVAAHLSKGHTVAIVSAATPYQATPVARDLGINHVMSTRLAVKNGRFTGEIIEPACWGDGKRYAGEEFAKQNDLDLSKSFFYTDSAEDMPLLEIVGNPRPINPDGKLSSVAFQNDWPVFRFDDEETGVTNIIRTGLTAGSLIPAALAGVVKGVRNLSWREGVNSMMATVGDLGTTMAGIKVVVKGEENLTKARPAVFIFNHQSSADLLIASKLVRNDARGVAKKELEYTPIIGQMMKAAGVIFLDRKNKEKAIEALKPAVDALQNGTSIIIAPEGTRSKDYRLGKFKKGAFHLAMQAGVPIVPIMIKNAHDAMPKGSNVFRPAVVEVVVGAPVPTENWEVEKLNTYISHIRNEYLNTLGQAD